MSQLFMPLQVPSLRTALTRASSMPNSESREGEKGSVLEVTGTESHVSKRHGYSRG